MNLAAALRAANRPKLVYIFADRKAFTVRATYESMSYRTVRKTRTLAEAEEVVRAQAATHKLTLQEAVIGGKAERRYLSATR